MATKVAVEAVNIVSITLFFRRHFTSSFSSKVTLDDESLHDITVSPIQICPINIRITKSFIDSPRKFPVMLKDPE